MSAIGPLREVLSIQQEVRAADTGGGAELSWNEVTKVRGSVEPLNGKESVMAGGLTGTLLYKICFRYLGDLTTAMRIVWNGKNLNIRSIRNLDTRSRLLEVIAEEGAAV